MSAGRKAIRNANQMIAEVERIGISLGLRVSKRVPAGKTVWATARRIKLVLELLTPAGRARTKHSRVGIECICQDGPGTANQKFFAKIEDVVHWPMNGVVTYDGAGFKEEFRGVMDTYGAIPLEELEKWLRTFFNL